MADYQPTTVEWKHRIEATDHYRLGSGLRSRFAWWLRRFADKLDQGRSVRINVQTQPRLSRADTAACIMRGLDHTNRLAGELAQQAACEQAMRKTCSELFDTNHPADHPRQAGNNE